MSEKLRDYQVIDVFTGTFYKVRHKVNNNIFAWKAYNCSAHTDEQIQNVVNEVKTISKVSADNLLRYYDTILHAPTKTLYFVLEYVSGRSLAELAAQAQREGRHFAESFLWRLLHGLARAACAVEGLGLVVLTKCITSASVLVTEDAEPRVNCFEWASPRGSPAAELMAQAAALVRALCLPPPRPAGDKVRKFRYSDDLQAVLDSLGARRALRPDAVLYHPTVLTNLETLPKPRCIADILITTEYLVLASEVNKCDSEKEVELSKAIQPLPRTIFNVGGSPIYGNISPKRKTFANIDMHNSSQESLSPTLAALALELPGFVPRSRRGCSGAVQRGGRPHCVAEETFSQEWLARLAALRRREDALNLRERDLIAKEILHSPSTKVIPLNDSRDFLQSDSNGITLPPMLEGARPAWASRRHRRRSGSARRRKSYGYEELDSSLSADPGDSPLVITATKFTKDNLPRRNIFPEFSSKKVHFTAPNPFVESDDSVMLTFYDLDSVDKDGYQVPKQKPQKDITKFKYLDLEKITSEKRSALNWSHSSPSKQAKFSKSVLCDISNQSSIRKSPSKSSLGSNSSRLSMVSARSHWSVESSISKVSDSVVFERTRARRQSTAQPQTPAPPADIKKKSRKSLIPFKTPFKFMSSKS